MKNIVLFLFLILATTIFAQSKFTVNVANFSFTPANLTITVGDTVEFVNTSGVHWVDGTQATYPSNPVSFDNQSQSGTGWVYKEVFNTPGNYDYRCGIHTTTMFGSITVQTSTSIIEANQENKFTFYPNPSTQTINFKNTQNIKNIVLFSVKGEEILRSSNVKEGLDVTSLTPGTYFIKITDIENKTTNEKIIIK